MLTAYLDTNIISALAKKDFCENTMKSVLEVINYSKLDAIELHTSELTQEEIMNIPEEYRYHHFLIYNLIKNVSIVSECRPSNIVIGGYGGGNIVTRGFGGGGKDTLLISIDEIIHRPNNEQKAKARDADVRHLYQCKKNNLEIFWTEDKQTILNKKGDLARIGIIVMSSEQLINRINS